MKVAGHDYRSIEASSDGAVVVDQTRLPFTFERLQLRTVEDAARAIATMQVRGAPLIGATAAWGLALAARVDPSATALRDAATRLGTTRPTAVNLARILEEVLSTLLGAPPEGRAVLARRLAQEVCDREVDRSRRIGLHGLEVLRRLARGMSQPLQVLTHCNAGWLATVDYGTALAPLYLASDEGLPLHVWVDETRPRNQGASLTAWELGQHGIPHTVIVDNAGGLLMQQGRVHACIVGADRIAANGDVCNKVGTYLKALAASDCGVPFYVAAPESSIDWALDRGAGTPIEERDAAEVTHMSGQDDAGVLRRVRLTAPSTRVHNPGFDVTPGRLVTALITERGTCAASREGLLSLFTERA